MAGRSGTIKLANGQDYPAQHVITSHPALADALPVSNALWRAGHVQYLNHCHYMDDEGGLSAITLYGVLFGYNRASQDLAPVEALRGAFGGLITPEQLIAAAGNVDRLQSLFIDAIWRRAGGDVSRALALAKEAEARDAGCSALLRREITTVLELNRQRMSMTRDSAGRPVIVRTVDASAATTYRKALVVLTDNVSLVRTLIPVYESTYRELLRRGARPDVERPVSPPVTAPPVAMPPPARPAPAAPSAQPPREGTPASRTPAGQPRAEPVSFEGSAARRLRESVQEDEALMQRIQRNCLLVADYNNCR